MRVRFVPVPLMARPLAKTKNGLDELGTTLRLSAGVSTSATVNARGGVDEFWLIVWLVILEITGRSLTGFTVSKNLRVTTSWLPFVAVTVMVVKPDWSGAGVIKSARLPSLPPSRRFASGTRSVFDERAAMLKAALGVVASVALKPTTNGV